MESNSLIRANRLGDATRSNLEIRAQIGAVKASIFYEFGECFPVNQHLLELAVNEAEALAWEIGFPGLLFPSLAEEKAQAVVRWHARQQCLRRFTPIKRHQ